MVGLSRGQMLNFLSQPKFFPLISIVLLSMLPDATVGVTKSFVNKSMPDMRPTFVINFDLGILICQHSNESFDVHLHPISFLCDGKSDCYSNPAMHDESFPYCEGQCNSTCHGRGACLFDGTRGQCYCNSGFHGPNCELTDNNECKDKPCHWLAHCQNTLGSYNCTCFPGFQGDGHNCTDIDECQTGLANCPKNSECVNLPGTYFCNCSEGYQPLGLPLERCADVDECEQQLHDCEEPLKCQNEIGSFKCVHECDVGYRLVNESVCVDIDECSEKTDQCDKRASCSNLIGGYQCTCEDGFTGDGHTCTPRNDCSQQEGICDRHAFCIGNLRMCICQSGYVGDGLSCYDVNECASTTNPCDGQSAKRCVNIDGGFICCDEGLDDDTCIREKGAFCSGGCGIHAICYNETCQCLEGFTGDPNMKCSDINECENDKQCLGAGEWCVNMHGGYVCCSQGSQEPTCLLQKTGIRDRTNQSQSGTEYIHGSHQTAGTQRRTTGGFVVINGQVIATEPPIGLACHLGCPADSHCVNHTCQCNDGFVGNTLDGCADVNECDLGVCNETDSWCINLRGTFVCCTVNSSVSDCIGLEISVAGTQLENLKTSSGLPSPSDSSQSASSSSSSSTTAISGGQKTNARGEWRVQTVGEWRNFTGHAVIIGHGRIGGDRNGINKSSVKTSGIDTDIVRSDKLAPKESQSSEVTAITTSTIATSVTSTEMETSSASVDTSSPLNVTAEQSTELNSTDFIPTETEVSEITTLSSESTTTSTSETFELLTGNASEPSSNNVTSTLINDTQPTTEIFKSIEELQNTTTESSRTENATIEYESTTNEKDQSKSTFTKFKGEIIKLPDDIEIEQPTTVAKTEGTTSTPTESSAQESETTTSTSVVEVHQTSTEAGTTDGVRAVEQTVVSETSRPETAELNTESTIDAVSTKPISVTAGELFSSTVEASSQITLADNKSSTSVDKPTTVDLSKFTFGEVGLEIARSKPITVSTSDVLSRNITDQHTESEAPLTSQMSKESSESITSTTPVQSQSSTAEKQTIAEASSTAQSTVIQTLQTYNEGGSTPSSSAHTVTDEIRIVNSSMANTLSVIQTTTASLESGSQATSFSEETEAKTDLATTGIEEPKTKLTTPESVVTGSTRSSEFEATQNITQNISTDETVASGTPSDLDASSTFLENQTLSGLENELNTTEVYRFPIDREGRTTSNETLDDGQSSTTDLQSESSITSTVEATTQQTTLLSSMTSDSATVNPTDSGYLSHFVITMTDDKTNLPTHTAVAEEQQPYGGLSEAEKDSRTTTPSELSTSDIEPESTAYDQSRSPSSSLAQEPSGPISTTQQSTIQESSTGSRMQETERHVVSSTESIIRTTLQETVLPQYATLEKQQESIVANETFNLTNTTAEVPDNNTTELIRCISSNECGLDSYCERRSGVCRCLPGFSGQPPTKPCTDVDECSMNVAVCGSSTRCMNYVGGYACHCQTGFRKNSSGICVDIDECSEQHGNQCNQNALCRNSPGSYLCECLPEFEGDGYSCIPKSKQHCTIEQWDSSDCGRNQFCLVNSNGTIDCSTCRKGFIKRRGACEDVNECSKVNFCHENALCNNMMGSYSCQCQPGYKGDGFHCDDINECEENPCHPQASCTNIPGSFMCKCPEGWPGDAINECINPNDTACLNMSKVCKHVENTACLSIDLGEPKSICECSRNYRFNQSSNLCEDIDECAENRHNCDPSTSLCVNNDGGYTCECSDGYQGVGGVCVDVDECEQGIAGCSHAAVCENYIGSVGCKCAPGFTGDGIVCTEIHAKGNVATGVCDEKWQTECRAENKTCHIDDELVPQCGSCLPGFQPSNGKCLPLQGIGNCGETNDCDVNADCIDVRSGRHFCICKVGYIGDGRLCDDVDECSFPGYCDPVAHCRNTNGSFSCQCPDGYTGNGFQCIQNTNIHGGPNCHLDLKMCHRNAQCQIDGTCKCDAEYIGDGIHYCQLQTSVSEVKEESMEINATEIADIESINGASNQSTGLGNQTVSVSDESTGKVYIKVSTASSEPDLSESTTVSYQSMESQAHPPGISPPVQELENAYSGSGAEKSDGATRETTSISNAQSGKVSESGTASNISGKLEPPTGKAQTTTHQTSTKTEVTTAGGDGISASTESVVKSAYGLETTTYQTSNETDSTTAFANETVDTSTPTESSPENIMGSEGTTYPVSTIAQRNITTENETAGVSALTGSAAENTTESEARITSAENESTTSTGNETVGISASTGSPVEGTPELKTAAHQTSTEAVNTTATENYTLDASSQAESAAKTTKESEVTTHQTSTEVESSSFVGNETVSSSPSTEFTTESTKDLETTTISEFVQSTTIKVQESVQSTTTTKIPQQTESVTTVTTPNSNTTSEQETKSTIIVNDKSEVDDHTSVSQSDRSGSTESPESSFVATKISEVSTGKTVQKTSENASSISEGSTAEISNRTAGSSTQNRTSIIRKCTIGDHSMCQKFAQCAPESGFCQCRPGYFGDGYSSCELVVPDCRVDASICDLRAVCDMANGICKCLPGYVGDGKVCSTDTFDCKLRPNLCSNYAECVGRRCVCNSGYTGDGAECVSVEPFTDCEHCSNVAKCVNGTCVCDEGYFGNGATCIANPEDCVHYFGICSTNAYCDEESRKCHCIKGYHGNGLDCSERMLCTNDASICHENAYCMESGICQCKAGYTGNGFNCNAAVLIESSEATALPKTQTLECTEKCKINEHCEKGECICATGYKKLNNGTCVDMDECAMGSHNCHPVAKCTNVQGSFECTCPTGYYGDGTICAQRHSLQNMAVDCELDGMTLILMNDTDLINGRIFVRGQTENPFCSKKLSELMSNETEYHFKIPFAHCDVQFDDADTISVNVIIQRHPTFITQKADAYDVRCTYPTGIRKVVSHVDISEITTTKTIIENGTEPTCSLKVTNVDDQVIDTATVGEVLKLELSVQPNETYTILPKNCFAINLESGELYSLTDDVGCAIDTQLFPEWMYDDASSIATATFKTFKWPDSSMIRFQCDCSACIQNCTRVDCQQRRESQKQNHLRYARGLSADKIDSEEAIMEQHIVKGSRPLAFSASLQVHEDEELVRAQDELNRWKYHEFSTADSLDGRTMISSSNSSRMCVKTMWLIASLLPLVLLLAFVGILSLIWKRRTSSSVWYHHRFVHPPSNYDADSSYLKF